MDNKCTAARAQVAETLGMGQSPAPELGAHLRDCSDCATFFHKGNRIIKALKEIQTDLPPESLDARVLRLAGEEMARAPIRSEEAETPGFSIPGGGARPRGTVRLARPAGSVPASARFSNIPGAAPRSAATPGRRVSPMMAGIFLAAAAVFLAVVTIFVFKHKPRAGGSPTVAAGAELRAPGATEPPVKEIAQAPLPGPPAASPEPVQRENPQGGAPPKSVASGGGGLAMRGAQSAGEIALAGDAADTAKANAPATLKETSISAAKANPLDGKTGEPDAVKPGPEIARAVSDPIAPTPPDLLQTPELDEWGNPRKTPEMDEWGNPIGPKAAEPVTGLEPVSPLPAPEGGKPEKTAAPAGENPSPEDRATDETGPKAGIEIAAVPPPGSPGGPPAGETGSAAEALRASSPGVQSAPPGPEPAAAPGAAETENAPEKGMGDTEEKPEAERKTAASPPPSPAEEKVPAKGAEGAPGSVNATWVKDAVAQYGDLLKSLPGVTGVETGSDGMHIKTDPSSTKAISLILGEKIGNIPAIVDGAEKGGGGRKPRPTREELKADQELVVKTLEKVPGVVRVEHTGKNIIAHCKDAATKNKLGQILGRYGPGVRVGFAIDAPKKK